MEFRDTGMVFPDGTEALAGVDLTVRTGEFVSVVGPSGCGKSTLLRLASRLEEATSGLVEIVTEHPAYVFQDATLLPWRSIRRNVELLAELSGMSRTERNRRTAEALDLVGLTAFADHLPHQLSGGMRMRASLARSLTLIPELFLFDEPFGALDEITREKLNEELTRLYAARSFSALFITHSVNEAIFLSGRVAVMSSRPGSVAAIFDVPFAFPREPDVRFTPEFTRLAAEVSASLREANG